MRKHTPGPWHLDFLGNRNRVPVLPIGASAVVARNGSLIAICPTAGDWRVNVDMAVPGPRKQSVNAALIAAAPELLEACEAAFVTMRNCPGNCQALVTEKLRAAIGKAEGKA